MTRDLHALTSLRGVAALSVAMLHVHYDFGYSWNVEDYTLYLDKAYLWVDFFFILSGFILSHVYAGDFVDGASGRAVRRFLIKRFARIYPLHLLTLCFFWAVALLKLSVGARTAGHVDPALIPTHLFLMQAWGWPDGLYWNYPSWSISAEAAAYLLFPWLCLVVGPARRAQILLLAGGCLAGLALLQALDLGRTLKHATYDTGAIRCLLEFVLGMLLYRAHMVLSSSPGPGLLVDRLGGDAVAFGSFAALVVAMHLGAPELAIIALCALAILTASLNRGAFSRCFSVRPLLWLGAVSYAVYMLHAPLDLVWGPIATRLPDSWVGDPIQAAAYFAAFLLALLIAAGLTHRFFEVPARTYLTQFASIRLAQHHLQQLPMNNGPID
ncbi:MAG TPA: acyltransferase [Trueperaceae bacterium]